jgi:hypothetical protein
VLGLWENSVYLILRNHASKGFWFCLEWLSTIEVITHHGRPSDPQDELLLVYTHRQIFMEHGTNIYARRQVSFTFAIHLISKFIIPSRTRMPSK